MSDYQKDQQANERAVRIAPWMWGGLALFVFLAFVYLARNELVFLYYTRIF